MPVNEKKSSGGLSTRLLYKKSSLTRLYADYKDERILNSIDPKTLSILDLGCGEGMLLEKLLQRFPQADTMGIDYMNENVQICESLGLPAQQGDLYHLPIHDNSIETLLLIEVIEHLSNPEKALGEVGRVLKPNGKVIIVFPNDKFFSFARLITFKFKERAEDYGHVRQWTHKDLKELLIEKGLIVKRSISLPFWFWPISLHGLMVVEKPDV